MAPRWYINLSVIICGGVVLAVEMAGTRLMGPFYGAGLYLWSALISVTLLALSAGYLLGGRLADRIGGLGIYCTLIAGAGLWTAVVPWIFRPVLLAAAPMGLRGAVLVSSLVLFFPPFMLLGMLTPYAVRLRTESVEVVGKSAGELYALSTIAGVITALAAGFFLIPALGAGRLVFIAGCLLLVTTLIGASLCWKRTIRAFVMAAAVVAAAAGLDPEERNDPEAGLLEIAESPYAEIRVVEYGGLRFMLIDGNIHTEVDALTLESRSGYVDVLELAAGFYYQPGRVLLVGLGGGSVVKQYRKKGWEIDAVEIDPAVTRMARSHFGLEPSDARIHHMDGREFLTESEEEYELIIVDAFGSSSIPFHLVTEEAFALLEKRLAPHGVVAMNVIAVGWHDELVHSLAATLRRVFACVTVLPMAEPPDQLGNLIIIAANREIELIEEPPVPLDRFAADYNRAHAWDNRFEVDTLGVRVLTDDRNPVDVWAERINLKMRISVHEYFGLSGIGW